MHVERGVSSVLITLLGEHDISTSDEVRRALAGARGAELVVVDLADCTFMDSTVLGVLASAQRHVRDAGGRVVAVNASGIVARALEITGVGQLLDLRHDVDVAELLARTGPDAR